MGLSLARKNDIIAMSVPACLPRSELIQRYPPLYTFCTTGVAGSVTTFSSWMLESYLAFSNFRGYSRGGLYDVSVMGALLGVLN